ncbi:LAFE_0G18140g1_1 [Lachancea fermentati]|uniref:LAFE_0G18140g1_1 n=1 Tax=Lachancea fermentati TaxID=4955 RepID=A0A1G4MIR7_LACFM|nr:LAFE_0G18140g1_1 [Lachancea fermentati]
MPHSDSDSESHHSNEGLSPTASLNVSLASMNTEEHNELYDHRQHPDSLPVRTTSDGNASNLTQMSHQNKERFKGGSEPRAKARPLNSGISFDDDSDNEMAIGSQQFRSSALHAANIRPSRLAHSIPHQKQLFTANGQLIKNPPLAARRSSKTNTNGEPSASKQKSRANSDSSSTNHMHFLSKTLSSRSNQSESNTHEHAMRRRLSKATIESDNSHASRESQETEEDVCFPMQHPEHKRINGIDFDDLEEFVIQSNEENLNNNTVTNVTPPNTSPTYLNKEGSSSSTSTTTSTAALKYTPKVVQERVQSGDAVAPQINPGIVFGSNKVENDFPEHDNGNCRHSENYVLPDRFSFFRSDSDETIHAPSIPSLVKPGETFRELFKDGSPTWWLDCVCPTDEEMRCISKAFGLHPLTAEDIRMQETREKVELFKSYYFVCFHTFENDKESEEFLEPINVYIVVFREGVLTFHFGPIEHCSNVRRRVRQLRDYVDVSSDWLCYALIDDITDSFAPVIQAIEYEADAIEDSVFMARDQDFAAMLQRIGESRRKTMTLMRLLSGKADVIKMFAKRCQDEVNGIGPALTSQLNIANLQYSQPGISKDDFARQGTPTNYTNRAQPRADIALYLGDIQDHVVTMFQNLLSYEKIFSRSHANYLAQLQVESFNSNNKVTEMLSKVTIIGTILVPLNVVTGLFGMNVHVPGQHGATGSDYGWFFGILGVMIFIALFSAVAASWWLSRITAPSTLNEASESGTRSIISTFRPRGTRGSKPFDFSRPQKSNRSLTSLPTKITRYN